MMFNDSHISLRPNSGSNAETETPEAEQFVRGLTVGDERVVAWIRQRARSVGAPSFSGWAWRMIEDDFVADLLYQLARVAANPQFEPLGSVGAYVDTSIRNLCRLYFSRLARARRSLPLDEMQSDLPAPRIATLERVSETLQLRTALLTLGPACRRLLVLKYVDGLSLAEIADRVGTEPKTAQSRLHTCRERLRSIWNRADREKRSTNRPASSLSRRKLRGGGTQT